MLPFVGVPRRARWLFDFQYSDADACRSTTRCRHDTCDTPKERQRHALRTNDSGDAALTNGKLPRVASVNAYIWKTSV